MRRQPTLVRARRLEDEASNQKPFDPMERAYHVRRRARDRIGKLPLYGRARVPAGIRVVMLTGDHPATALHIASQIGLRPTECVTGAELAGLDDEALRERAHSLAVPSS